MLRFLLFLALSALLTLGALAYGLATVPALCFGAVLSGIAVAGAS